ncbi:protein of unknown function [Methanoculleus bourgensis]|uniref:Uncharacterized protein n=1 Tax=Methanoculleus bourgensis TaxID=83986 RepID=A0A0X3BNJ3_9EURY|nr:protein of unknown function [Methanoculleus bourgensis]
MRVLVCGSERHLARRPREASLFPGSGPWWPEHLAMLDLSPVATPIHGFSLGIASGVGLTGEQAPIGANLPHGALRSGLAIGEVQALLNPCTGSGDHPHPPQREW